MRLTENEKKEILKANKIELLRFNSVKGFTKDEQKEIINRLIDAYNSINDVNFAEDCEIKVNSFKLTTIYKKQNILNCLLRFKAEVKNAETETKNKTFEKIKKLRWGDVYETSDAYSDGSMAISKKYIGNVPKNETTKKVMPDRPLNSFLSDKLIKIDNYNKGENIRRVNQKDRYFILYKGKEDLHAFNQEYINFFKKDCIFYMSADKTTLYAFRDGELVGIIMGMIARFNNFDDFELLPEIENTSKDEIISKDEKLPDEVTKILNETTQNMIKSPEYKKLVTEHKNIVTGHVYSGKNADLLNYVMEKKKYNKPFWVGKYQARRLDKQVKQYADGAVIKVFYSDDDGKTFCKLETVYNVAELEPLQKVENTNDFKNMIERLKAV